MDTGCYVRIIPLGLTLQLLLPVFILHESTVKATFNTRACVLGVYRERRLGVLYESWGINPSRGIGVASCRALGHVPPSRLPTIQFFRSLQSRTNSDIRLRVASYQAKCSFIIVYCMNFVIFLCITDELFSVSFVPLLAPNAGDANGQWRFYVGARGAQPPSPQKNNLAQAPQIFRVITVLKL